MAANPLPIRRSSLLALVLIVGAAAAAPVPASSFGELDGVTYYFAQGSIASGRMVNHGADTGDVVVNAAMCAFAQLRPELGRGRIQVQAVVDNLTYVTMEFEDFWSPDDGVTPVIVTNQSLDAALGQQPQLRVSAAAWGPIKAMADFSNFTDPVGTTYANAAADDQPPLDGTFFVSLDGERNDATEALQSTADRGDVEMHLRVRSPSDAKPAVNSFTIAPPGGLPDGSFAPNEAYSDRFYFPNVKFGGTANVVVSAQANAPQGHNELEFTFSSPTGVLLGETTLRPALLAPGAEELSFPLNEFGEYLVEVRGKVSLGEYQIAIDMTPPKALDLDIWWDDVTVGNAAKSAMSDCSKELGYPTVPSAVVGRPKPPNWFMEMVILGLVAGTASVLLVVKVVGESIASSQLKKRFGR